MTRFTRLLADLNRWAMALLVVGAVAGSTVACLKFPRRYIAKTSYALEAERPAGPTAQTVERSVLKVRSFRASPLYEGQKLVYRKPGPTYETDFYHEFFIPPASMIAERIERWLALSGRFEQVVHAASRVEPTHLLEGTLRSIYGDLADAANPLAVLELELVLLRVRPSAGSPEIVFHHTYRQQAPLENASPEAVVRGLDAALERLLIDFEGDLLATDLGAAQTPRQ